MAVSLSKAQVLALLSELMDGFASENFQHQLLELAKNGSDTRCVEGRQALALAVQKQVLPRYGFQGDEEGVVSMKIAVRKHMGDPRVARKSMDIRDKLMIPETRMQPPAVQAAPAAPAVLVAPVQPKDPAPIQESSARPEKAALKKDEEMEVMVQHTRGNGQLVVRVPAEATMLQVKEAVVSSLGRGSVSEVSLVMWGGGMFVNHRDCDMVMTERVFSTGLDLRTIN